MEDNEHDIVFVREVVKRSEQQLQLSVVQDGAQALDFLYWRDPYTQAAPPTLILLDLNLPVTSGFEVLAVHEYDAQLKCIPTIVLTTSTRPEGITRAMSWARTRTSKGQPGSRSLPRMDTVIEFWGEYKFRLLAQILFLSHAAG